MFRWVLYVLDGSQVVRRPLGSCHQRAVHIQWQICCQCGRWRLLVGSVTSDYWCWPKGWQNFHHFINLCYHTNLANYSEYLFLFNIFFKSLRLLSCEKHWQRPCHFYAKLSFRMLFLFVSVSLFGRANEYSAQAQMSWAKISTSANTLAVFSYTII